MKLNRQQNPSLQQISNLRLPKMEVLKLDNHIPAWMINTGSQELLKLQFSFPAGSIYQNKALVSFFTLQMLLEGSQNYSAAQTAERLDFLGAFINTRSSKDFAYLEVFCLNKHLKEVLEIVKDILTQALFPVKELNVLKQQHKQAHIIDIGKVQTQARRSFNQEIFGAQNTYGRLASLSDFEKLKAEDLRLFYQKQFAPSNWSLFVSGKIGPKEVASIQEYIGSIKVASQFSVSKPVLSFEDVNPRKIILEQETAVQTAIKMGCFGLDKQHADYAAYDLAQTIIGGYFGSRLMKNIREDKGYTYGIHSGTQAHKQKSVFTISSQVGSAVAEQALEEIKKELHIMRTQEVGTQELQLVKNYISGSILRSLNGPFALGEMMRMLKENQLPDHYFAQYLLKMQAVGAQDILAACHKYFQEDNMLIVMAGGVKND